MLNWIGKWFLRHVNSCFLHLLLNMYIRQSFPVCSVSIGGRIRHLLWACVSGCSVKYCTLLFFEGQRGGGGVPLEKILTEIWRVNTYEFTVYPEFSWYFMILKWSQKFEKLSCFCIAYPTDQTICKKDGNSYILYTLLRRVTVWLLTYDINPLATETSQLLYQTYGKEKIQLSAG